MKLKLAPPTRICVARDAELGVIQAQGLCAGEQAGVNVTVVPTGAWFD